MVLFKAMGENQCALMVRKIQLVKYQQENINWYFFCDPKIDFRCQLYFCFNWFSSSEFFPSFDQGTIIIITIDFHRDDLISTLSAIFFFVGDGWGKSSAKLLRED